MNAGTDTLARALARADRENGLFPAGSRVLAAVSGGADSMALLLALLARGAEAGFTVAAAHLHHGIRGADADADAAFVRAACARLGVSLHEGRADAPDLAQRRGISLEMAAREARYAFLRAALADAGAAVVAVAHTADDQAETVLLKLLRGAGPRGLSGMAARGVVLGVPVARPLLAVGRRAIEAYLRARGEPWREDASNQDTGPLRNRVRHDLLPLLERHYNPRVRAALVRTAHVFEEEERWLAPLVEQAAAAAGGERLRAAALAGLPPALRRRVWRAWLIRAGVPEADLDFALSDRLERALKRRTGSAVIEVGGGWRVHTAYGEWRAGRAGPAELPDCPLALPGVTDAAAWGVRVRAASRRGHGAAVEPGAGAFPCRAFVDAARVAAGGGLRLRAWRPGDRLALAGGGTKKVQDVFTDAKVPRARRAAVPLVVCGEAVVWVPGAPPAADWRVPGPAAPAWRLDIESI